MATRVQLTGGAFQDSEGNVLANGYLRMYLSQDASVAGVGNVCSGIYVQIALDGSGNVVASPAQSVWGNDQLSPTNTYYRVYGYAANGQLAWGPNNQQVLGSGGTFNVGTWVPNLVINWQPIAPTVYQIVSAIVGLPTGGQFACIYTAPFSLAFNANFSGSVGSVGTNPTATATYNVLKNGVSVGSIVVSTGGVVTFSTISGNGFTMSPADRFTITAPGVQDATLADVAITVVATRIS